MTVGQHLVRSAGHERNWDDHHVDDGSGQDQPKFSTTTVQLRGGALTTRATSRGSACFLRNGKSPVERPKVTRPLTRAAQLFRLSVLLAATEVPVAASVAIDTILLGRIGAGAIAAGGIGAAVFVFVASIGVSIISSVGHEAAYRAGRETGAGPVSCMAELCSPACWASSHPSRWWRQLGCCRYLRSTATSGSNAAARPYGVALGCLFLLVAVCVRSKAERTYEHQTHCDARQTFDVGLERDDPAIGAQNVAMGALRGLNQGRLTIYSAIVGYWLVRIPLACWLGVVRGIGATGVGIGVGAGLHVSAAMLLHFLHRAKHAMAVENDAGASQRPIPFCRDNSVLQR